MVLSSSHKVTLSHSERQNGTVWDPAHSSLSSTLHEDSENIQKEVSLEKKQMQMFLWFIFSCLPNM
jgi:hypothetical protein